MTPVPATLRYWFVAHFALDFLIAIGLLVAPGILLSALGFEPINLVFARLVGAAFVAIGGTSFLIRNEGVEVYISLLILKLLWSGGAILGIVLSLLGGAPASVWIFLAIFALFFIVWAYYLNRIRH